ncbi:MAG TPA: electron transfer flavoprotein subunit alpha/FixB family protein [Gemmataceae bacterium]|jgi:electron transfer flavoprotein alpha subunit
MNRQSAHDPRPGEAVIQVLATLGANGKWSALTLELLGDASTLARRWSGRVGAWVLTAPSTPVRDFDELAAHGCHLVWHLRNDRLAQWSSEAVAVALRQGLSPACRMILLPGDARGEEVAALLAEHLGTDWIADAITLAVNRANVLEITAVLPGGKLARTFRVTADRPPVVTMRPGVPEACKVDKPPPLEVRTIDVDLSAVPELTTVERSLPADPHTVDLVFAQRIVSAGRGTGGPEGVRLVAELADTLGASLGASRMVVDLGWAPAERQVGQTGRTVRPDLYVACGISGASHHLAGMRESKHIVALNPDAAAPIHEVAHLSLPGDLHQVIPAIRAALQRRTSLPS